MRLLLILIWIIESSFSWSTLAESDTKIYTNQWGVEIQEGQESADEVATRNGFRNLGKIASLENYYLFEHKRVRKRSLFKESERHSLLEDDPKVTWCQQQRIKRRVKREVGLPLFSDPDWPRMWYLNRRGETMNVVGAWLRGFTGKGTVVSILDDGIEHTHTDLAGNYDPLASYDFVSNDEDPMPDSSSHSNNHGTRCAGEVAAVANNRKCTVGVAYHAKIGGVRMLEGEGDGDVTDAVEAKAFGFKNDYIAIYSASWGPADNGMVVDGPDRMAQKAFLHGITKGRNGKGSIYIWASGNGGSLNDSCSCDGYASSLYTFSVGGVTENGYKPWYLEECSSTLATTYSSGDTHRERKILTIDSDNHCGEHTGTSSSAAMAAGLCALTLQANPNLTWRDIQHIVVMTARKMPIKQVVWSKNGVGRLVSHGFGFGLMDGLAMTQLAKQWTTVPEWHSCPLDYQRVELPIDNFLELNASTTACGGFANEVNFLEHVEATVWLTSSRRGDLQISLVSPNGTASVLLPRREKDILPGQFRNWTFMSVFYWGENPTGEWKLIVKHVGKSNHSGTFHGWQLKLHGTETPPTNISDPDQSLSTDGLHVDDQLYETDPPDETEATGASAEVHRHGDNFTSEAGLDVETCHEECLEGVCSGPSRYNCSVCKNFMTIDGGCVSSCPNATYVNATHICVPCPPPCQECTPVDGDHDDDVACLTCRVPFYHLSRGNEMTCAQSCPVRYFAEKKQRKCMHCPENCVRCIDGASCLDCARGFDLHLHRCHAACNWSEFRSKNYSCLACHENCRTCSGPESFDCVECAPDHLWQKAQCVANCSQGFYFKDSDKKDPICEMCDPLCPTCFGPMSHHCTSCPRRFKLHDNSCTDKCPPKFFESPEHVCTSCAPECLNCSGPSESDCRECADPWVLFEGQCLKECPKNSFFVDTNLYTGRAVRECHGCHHTCNSCTGSSQMQCMSCSGNLYYAYGQCVDSCKSHEFEFQGKCLECHQSCLTCSGASPDKCTACSMDSYLVHDKCLHSCPYGYYAFENECLRCGEGCKTCLGGNQPEFCTSCYEGEPDESGECKIMKTICLTGSFFDENTMECKPCYDGCANCSGPNGLDCISCQTSHVLHLPTSLCVLCCSESVRNLCCLCSLGSDVCHKLMEDNEIPGIVVVEHDIFEGGNPLPRATHVPTTEGTNVSEASDGDGDGAYDEAPTTQVPKVDTTPARHPISLFSIILSACLALLVTLAIAFVIAFCLFQAKAHNKLCWSKQQYQSVPLWQIYDPKGERVRTDRRYPPVNV